MTHFKERVDINDNLVIKVNRANSVNRKIKRFFGLEPYFKPRTINESVFGDGFLTAIKREYISPGVYKEHVLCFQKHNLLVNAGRDFFHTQCYGTSGIGSNGTNYIAVTATAITPGATDTTLSGELTSNGFTRVQGTVAHTSATNLTTVTTTFTATSTQNNVQASALFTAVSSGTMSHEATFTSTNFATNDQLQIQWSINLG